LTNCNKFFVIFCRCD